MVCHNYTEELTVGGNKIYLTWVCGVKYGNRHKKKLTCTQDICFIILPCHMACLRQFSIVQTTILQPTLYKRYHESCNTQPVRSATHMIYIELWLYDYSHIGYFKWVIVAYNTSRIQTYHLRINLFTPSKSRSAPQWVWHREDFRPVLRMVSQHQPQLHRCICVVPRRAHDMEIY